MPGGGIIAIGDDLTGSLEIGAKFAALGLRATVMTSLTHASVCETPVVVIDTETRHSPAGEAACAVREVAELARGQLSQLIYKKTDSTLRGNIAAELGALQEVFPTHRLLYAPAYPDLGRTVKEGRLLVHGRPVHETEFADDRWSPVRDCRVHAVLGRVEAVVMDGESSEDIDHAADSILAEAPPRICAGPAALAGALARKIGSAAPARLPKVKHCLVVNGSLHPSSISQIRVASQAQVFDDTWELLDEAVEGAGTERAARVGDCVRRKLDEGRFDAVVVFGGETAFGIHRALGSDSFEALGEISTGVAVSRTGELLWITKAGGFGPPEVLEAIREQLT